MEDRGGGGGCSVCVWVPCIYVQVEKNGWEGVVSWVLGKIETRGESWALEKQDETLRRGSCVWRGRKEPGGGRRLEGQDEPGGEAVGDRGEAPFGSIG